jgi:hypothetical protein
MAIRHWPRRRTTDLDLRAKIGDENGDIRNRRSERRFLKCPSLEIGVVWTYSKFSCRTRDVEVKARYGVVCEDWMQNWG